ncbi:MULTISPECIES: hypothetical protein [unclassified Solwaraspora]|uniref:hypothetical protein n=1 Tax=unclassified Solwaraspora TaxID=2627926 RepID=UPI00259B527A|nr:hypothetical protein [Solwaraspora sp. WMMA2056]WJK40224.1 hypothetical protein O7608_28055 [Solwaraspora sp. WMMA2056]
MTDLALRPVHPPTDSAATATGPAGPAAAGTITGGTAAGGVSTAGTAVGGTAAGGAVGPRTADDAAAAPTAAMAGQAYTGLAVAALALLGLAVGGPLQAPAAVAFAVLGPGAALLSHLTVRPTATRWALTVLASLAGYAAVATGSVWVGWWQPQATVAALAAAVAVACVTALARIRRQRAAGRLTSRVARLAAGGPVPRSAAAVRPLPAHARPLLAHVAVLGIAVALWLIALTRTDLGEVGGFGLLGTISPVWVAALAVTVGGFVTALAGLRRDTGLRRQTELRGDTGRGVAAAGYLVALVALLHGTTPLLLDEPQYAWTYKHLGVIEYLAAGNPVGAAQDIYQQWPALFAGAAQLGAVGGIAPATLADWSPVFFNLAAAPVLYAIARTLSGDRRVAYLTVFGFVAVNWIEEDYLSPQALGFLLSLGVLLVVLTWLRTPGDGTGRQGGGTGRPGQGRRVPVVPVLGVLALLAVLTAAHQLSPYLVVAQVAVLAVLRLIRPRWLPLAMGVIVVGYLLPRFGFVSESFGVFDGFDIFSNAAGNADGWGSTGQAFSAIVVRTLALSVWALTALAVLSYRRRLRTVLVPALLAATPFVLIAGQSYGGEAIYRVFLFSAPWCAYLIAKALVDRADQCAHRLAGRAGAAPGRRWLGPVAAVTLAVALTGFALATVQGRHGQLVVDRQTSDEVAAARQLYATAEPGATIAVATSNFPSRLTAAYPEFNTDVPAGEPDLVVGAQLRGAALDGEHLPTIEEFLRSFDGAPAYLVVSDGMRRQADYFGYFPPGSLDRLEQLLDGRDGWSVFQRSADVTVYRYTG